MPSLADLEFEGCRHVTPRGVQHLAALPRFGVIKIAECPQVGRDVIRQFNRQVRIVWSV